MSTYTAAHTLAVTAAVIWAREDLNSLARAEADLYPSSGAVAPF